MTARRIFLSTLWCGLTALLASALAESNLAGKWEFVFQTPAGERKTAVDLKVEGTEVSGKFGDAALTGTYQDGKLELRGKVYSSEGGYTAELRITGKVENDQITGTAVWDTYQMTFEAKRAK